MSSIESYQLTPDLAVTRTITGLWQIADMERDGVLLDPAATSQFMEPYVEKGFTTFDMADHYGSAELIAGHFKTHSPLGADVKLFTKWVPKPGPVTREEVREAIEERRRRLQTERIDLLQYHSWTFTNPYWLDALIYLQELKEEGLIGAIGTTNFNTAHLRIAKSSGVEIVSNQISYSLIDQRGGGKMADYCAENGVAILAYGTLLGGFLSHKWLGRPEPTEPELSNWSLMKYKRFIDAAGGWELFQSVLAVLDEIASETKRSISTIASKYQLGQKSVGAVIIGARLGENSYLDDAASLFTFELTPGQLERIAAVLATLIPIPGDCGDEYRTPPYLTASGDLSHHLADFPAVYSPITKNGRRYVDSGTPWEAIAGYSRAIQIDNRILISGTTATHGPISVGGSDPIAQTEFVIDKIESVLESLGAKLSDVVRTRIYVTNEADCDAICRVHGERFAEIRPANTLVVAKLIGSQYLVEIEAEAITS
jgi:aryl-alcohol dehydrogenase-like predicted oxidoreductase/enamine deaminase RidA (YjgF/YER057c/UK114 family)